MNDHSTWDALRTATLMTALKGVKSERRRPQAGMSSSREVSQAGDFTVSLVVRPCYRAEVSSRSQVTTLKSLSCQVCLEHKVARWVPLPQDPEVCRYLSEFVMLHFYFLLLQYL